MTGAQIEREKAKRRLEEQARLRRDDYIEWKFKLANLDLSRESINTVYIVLCIISIFLCICSYFMNFFLYFNI